MPDDGDDRPEPQEPKQGEKPRWVDPGNDDVGIRNEAPENILDKMLRRDK